MYILKLDIAKQTGWAITEETWWNDDGSVVSYGTKGFWDRVPILAGNKVDLMFQFIIELHKKYSFDMIYIEQLNYFRNAKTTRSLLQQQAGAHFAALKLDIPIREVPTLSSYRKAEAVRLLGSRGIKVDNTDEADALMLGEKL